MRHSDGVPLFVEEMTKAVIESGVLREDVDAYHLDGPLSALAIPTTLHDSLRARLDRLQPVKEVAQTAAVIGRSFDNRTIAALSDRPADELASAMHQLVEAELIFRRGTPPEATYLFKHALVRDAAYESLLRARRITLHARLLDVLERRGDAAAEVMAQHAEAAGLTERAIGYWGRPARRHWRGRPTRRRSSAWRMPFACAARCATGWVTGSLSQTHWRWSTASVGHDGMLLDTLVRDGERSLPSRMEEVRSERA